MGAMAPYFAAGGISYAQPPHAMVHPHATPGALHGTPAMSLAHPYRTHQIEHAHPLPGHHAHSRPLPPQDALSEQQLNRLKAATACQIINQRVVEALKDQEKKKKEVLRRRIKYQLEYGDPNETNPNNAAYIGEKGARARKKERMRRKRQEKRITEKSLNRPAPIAVEHSRQGSCSPTPFGSYSPTPQTPQLSTCATPQDVREVSLYSNETASNRELSPVKNGYHRHNSGARRLSPYFCKSERSESLFLSPEKARAKTKQARLVPLGRPKPNPLDGSQSHPSPTRRRAPPPAFSPQRAKNPPSQPPSQASPARAKVRAKSPPRVQSAAADRVLLPCMAAEETEPEITVDMAQLQAEVEALAGKKAAAASKKKSLHVAPAHANVQSVISPNGGIYHPCHGYSTRDISIFDLFPGIVKYQSKKYNEADRVNYLTSLSDVAFVGVNNKPLKVDEAEMWYMALKYLFNDITLGQFDYMTVEMRYVIKQYMGSRRNRQTFLDSIKTYGFLRVISDVSKKLPREYIRKIMRQESVKKQKRKLKLLAENEKLKAENVRKLYSHRLLMQQNRRAARALAAPGALPPHAHAHAHMAHGPHHLAANATSPPAHAPHHLPTYGSPLGAYHVAPPPPFVPGGAAGAAGATGPAHHAPPVIVDADDAEAKAVDGALDHWDHVISKIVNDKVDGNWSPDLDDLNISPDIRDIPDLPAEGSTSKGPIALNLFAAQADSGTPSTKKKDSDEVYTMILATMNPAPADVADMKAEIESSTSR